jgi:hypothetical protein
MRSCGDAIEAYLSRVNPNSTSEYKIAEIPGKTYSVTVLDKKYDFPHPMVVRKYQSGNDFGGRCFSTFLAVGQFPIMKLFGNWTGRWTSPHPMCSYLSDHALRVGDCSQITRGRMDL